LLLQLLLPTQFLLPRPLSVTGRLLSFFLLLCFEGSLLVCELLLSDL
jgi:hypothetical protein